VKTRISTVTTLRPQSGVVSLEILCTETSGVHEATVRLIVHLISLSFFEMRKRN
jgi:hypothetical protein